MMSEPKFKMSKIAGSIIVQIDTETTKPIGHHTDIEEVYQFLEDYGIIEVKDRTWRDTNDDSLYYIASDQDKQFERFGACTLFKISDDTPKNGTRI